MEDVGAGSVAGRGSWPGLGRGMRLCFVLMVVAGVSGCGAARERPAVRMAESGVLPELRTAFAQVNPAATRVWILDVGTRPWGSGHPDAGDEYAVVATAWQPASEPLLNGELFGVFVVDSTFSRVNRVLNIFYNRRWHD